MRPTLSHAIPRRHRLTTPEKPHDSNGSVSNSEMPSWELHATFAGLHPLRGIAPDQNGCIVTDEVHDPISNRRQREYTSRTARPPPTGPTLRTVSLTRGRSHGPHQRVVGIRPQSRLYLSGVTPLSGALHQLGASAMLPNWCRTARHGSIEIS